MTCLHRCEQVGKVLCFLGIDRAELKVLGYKSLVLRFASDREILVKEGKRRWMDVRLTSNCACLGLRAGWEWQSLLLIVPMNFLAF
jgi:hypothetical protein